jgi:hypothetical protein
MRVYSSMPTEDFVFQLRQIAIGANASPLVIDQIDAIVAAPTEEEIADRIEEAELAEFRRGYDEGKDEGLADKDNAVEDACKELYAGICKAIEAKGKEIGLSDELIYKVVNHILWDCRP